MAYNDYGAFVYKNGVRQKHKEDTLPLGDPDLESADSGARIFIHIIKEKTRQNTHSPVNYMAHGVYGDGDLRLCMRKTYPFLISKTGDTWEAVDTSLFAEDISPYSDYTDLSGEFGGCKFKTYFDKDRRRTEVVFIDEDGATWTGYSGAECGAGHEDVEESEDSE